MENNNQFINALTYTLWKRLFDIMLSFSALSILLIFLLIIAVIIKITSKGPILFIDTRVGLGGRTIKVWKFRTMYADAESNIDKYLTKEQMETWTNERKLEHDPRITKIGRILRKTSIDELPQFFNCLFGNISLVGPRPISFMEFNEHYSGEEQKKLVSVKPGITGYWQVYGRNDVEFFDHKRQDLELEYIDKKSLWLDTKILFLTIPAVLKHKGVK